MAVYLVLLFSELYTHILGGSGRQRRHRMGHTRRREGADVVDKAGYVNLISKLISIRDTLKTFTHGHRDDSF